MPTITIYIDPPRTGILGKLYYIVSGVYYSLTDLPTSIDGVIIAGVGTNYPELTYIVVFPRQTVNGVTYEETKSTTFNLYGDITLEVALIPVAPTTPLTPLSGIVIATQLAVGLGLVFFKRK